MKQWFYVIILNAVAIAVWSFQLYQVGFPSQELLFNNPDSSGYLAVGHWLFGGQFTPLISLRTFLFPLWLICITGAFGLKGFFASQSILWLAGINLLYLGLIRLRLPLVISLVLSLIFCFNLTILSVSYEVMTETVTIFLCCLCFYVVVNCKSIEQLKEHLGMLLFIAALMMLLKPIFEFIFFIALAALIFFHLKERNSKQRKKNLLWLVVSLLPVTFQLLIMIHFAGNSYEIYNYTTRVAAFSFSGIAERNLRLYLLSQTFSSVEHLDIDTARKTVANWSGFQILQFAVAHPIQIGQYYFNNVHFNISTPPYKTPALDSSSFELNFMIWWNRFHWMAQLALPVLLIFSWKKIRQQAINVWLVVILALPMYDVILLSGVCFGQGDRLVLPAIPFAIGLYAMLFKNIGNHS